MPLIQVSPEGLERIKSLKVEYEDILLKEPAKVPQDIVRVVRIYTFEGPRDAVERQIANSLHGQKDNGNGVLIKVATLGVFPEIMEPS